MYYLLAQNSWIPFDNKKCTKCTVMIMNNWITILQFEDNGEDLTVGVGGQGRAEQWGQTWDRCNWTTIIFLMGKHNDLNLFILRFDWRNEWDEWRQYTK